MKTKLILFSFVVTSLLSGCGASFSLSDFKEMDAWQRAHNACQNRDDIQELYVRLPLYKNNPLLYREQKSRIGVLSRGCREHILKLSPEEAYAYCERHGVGDKCKEPGPSSPNLSLY